MKKIAVIGAMEMEVALLLEQVEGAAVHARAGMKFYEGRLRGTEAVVVRSGVGKVNAAVCTQILADHYGVDAVINTGVAGSLDAGIDIGDFVFSTDVCHHDVDATLFGYAPGEVPQLGQKTFAADPALILLAQKAFSLLGRGERVHLGRVVSGDQFIVSREKKAWIKETFDGLCTEMEGAAIAQTAWLNQLPFLVIRAISDKADESAQVEYPVFEERAAHAGADLLLRMMELVRRTDEAMQRHR